MQNINQAVEKLINLLAKVIVDKLANDEMDFESAQEISQFILEEKRKINSVEDLNQFIEKLTEKYFIFYPYLDNYENELQVMSEDQKKIELIKNQLLKFTQNQ